RGLKRRVIEPAIAEINEHSNLWVKYGQRKSGRTVTHFQFQFGVKDQPKQRKKLIV
ncbi:replication protein RepB, partial [Methylococcaceae bacterium HT1]